MKKLGMVLMLMLLSTSVFAGGEHPSEPYVGSAAFEKLKTLEGTWEGTVADGGTTEEKPAKVSYEISSGGTALIEKLGEGSPTEMVSIYNDEKGELVMTHYCLMRNQPKLTLISSDADHIHLEMTQEANGVKMTDGHMHSLKITFNGKDEITQEWHGFVDGEMAEQPVVITLKRV